MGPPGPTTERLVDAASTSDTDRFTAITVVPAPEDHALRSAERRSVEPPRPSGPDDPVGILLHTGVRERFIRYSIAGLTLAFGLIGFLSAFSPHGGAGSPARMTIIIALAVSTIPVALVLSTVNLGTVWWAKEASIKGINTAFVVYADLGVTAVLATFHSPLMALHGATLFAVIGGYVAHFVRLRMVIGHVAFSTAVIVACAVAAVLGGEPPSTTAYYAVVAVMASNGIVVLLRVYTIDFQQVMQAQLELAATDPLTGVFNRRGFLSASAAMLERGDGPFAIAMVDIDHYKQINDLYGHAVGDTVLQRLAGALQRHAGPAAIVGRLGGDEFAIAARLDRTRLHELADRLHADPLDVPAGRPITVSMGISVQTAAAARSRSAARDIVDRAINDADIALLQAKNAGRNTTRIVEPEGRRARHRRTDAVAGARRGHHTGHYSVTG